MALQNLYPKWFFSGVIEDRRAEPLERWRRVAWLGLGYLAVSVVMRMAFWHAGYRFFTSARERIAFQLRAQFFRHVNHLCLRFHGQHSSGELFSYLFGTPLANVMQFFQHVSVFVPGAAVTVVWTLAALTIWDPVTRAFLTFTSVWLVQVALEKNLGSRTAIFVAHRLATVRHCDRILVVDAGRVVEDGTYEVLLGRGGLFEQLVRAQELRA